jgi:Uma2 family endonuclease
MKSPQALVSQTTASPNLVHTPPINLPDHTQLPESDGTFVKNFQEHPQSIVLTSSIEPVLQKLHPDGRYCIGQDSGIYWHSTEPPEKGAEAPDWFYVPNVPPLVNGEFRRSYVMWQEIVSPLIAIEFVSGNGSEERDATPLPENDEIDPKTGKKKKAGKFWVYEQAVRIPFYAIFEPKKSAVEVYHLVDGRYEKMLPNDRGHYPIAPMSVELGIQFGTEETPIPWLRWWDADGNLLLTGDERAKLAEAIANQANLEKQQAEAIANQANLEKQQAEALLKKYRDRFGDIPE